MSGEFPSGFQWDEKKNQANILKHGIDFRDAVRVFEKPTFDRVDTRIDYGETRTNSLGELGGQFIVNVTHTDRSGDIRLISARQATGRERDRYREFLHDLAPAPNPLDALADLGRQTRQVEPVPKPEPEPDKDRDIWPDYRQGLERKKPD